MDVTDEKPKLDTRDCFFTLNDFYQMSCVHYILTRNFYKETIGTVEEKGKRWIKKIETVDSSENTPSNKVESADSSDVVFLPPRVVEVGKPLATMTMFDHQLYLNLHAKYAAGNKIAGTASEKQDLEILADLEKKVQNERNKVNDYLHYNACTSRRQDYFTINDVAHLFVSEVLKQELQYSLKYPRYYSTQKIIPLLASASPVKEIPFTFSKVVLKLGCPSPFLVPTAANNCVLRVKYEILCKRFPPSEIGDGVHPSKKHISRDDIAHKLAANYEADVVISLSSLRTLMDNIFPKFEHDWEIPVIVSDSSGDSVGGPHKCIYVEKSIPPLSLSVRAKNELFYSYALRCKFTHTYPQKSRKFKTGYAAPAVPDDVKPVSKEEQAELQRKMSDLASFDDIFEVTSEKVCELDTFGISSPKIQPSKPKVRPPNDQTPLNNGNHLSGKSTEDFKRNTGSGDDDEDDEDLLDDDDDNPFMRNLKGMIMKSCTPEKTASGASDRPAAVDVPMEKSGGKDSDFAQCLSPMSADSEHDGLVIDCDSEDKKPDFSVSAASERKEALSNEISGDGKAVSPKTCDLKRNKKIDLQSEDEDDDIGIKRRKMMPLPSEDGASNSFNVPSHKNESKNTDVTSPKAKKVSGTSQFKSPLDEILVSQHKMLKPEDNIDNNANNIELPKLSAGDSMDEIAKDFPPLSQPENVTYSLWHLGQLKILLRSEIDSQVSTTKCPTTPAFLFPKLEYQLMYGFEVTTPSELMKQWIHLYTHPGSHVVKVRINTPRSALAMLEEVNLPNLPQDKKYFDPKRAIQQLHTILDTLKSLSEGQYLLVHRKGEQTLTLQKAVNTAKHGAFDLHSSINQRLEEIDNSKDADTTRKEVPWLPIDSSIALPEHKRESRIPGCFYPIDLKKKRRNQNQKSDKKPAAQKQNKNKGQAKKT